MQDGETPYNVAGKNLKVGAPWPAAVVNDVLSTEQHDAAVVKLLQRCYTLLGPAHRSRAGSARQAGHAGLGLLASLHMLFVH